MNLKQMFTRKRRLNNEQFAAAEGRPADIELWDAVYAGGGEWRYTKKGGIEGGMRRVASLGAAKSLCAEMAALCFSQQADFHFKSELAGRYVMNVLQENGFWRCFPLFLEKMFALGSGVIKCYTQGGKVKLDFLGADSFLPVDYDEKSIKGGVILSSVHKDTGSYILCEVHEQEGSGYTITNLLYDEKGRPVELSAVFPNLERQTKIINLPKPLFVYFRPASVNNVGHSPLGISLFANAIDIIKALDTAFDSLGREFVLGRKRIIVPTSALRPEYDKQGNLRRYFDTSDEVYQAFSSDERDELKIEDNSGTLRVEEHARAIELLLDLLCMQVGLSQGTFTYKNYGSRTATEVTTQGSKTYRTKCAHQQLIREGLIDLCECIIALGRMSGEIPLNIGAEDTAAEIAFADGVMADNTAKIDNTVKLYNAGLIGRERALSEIYGMEDHTADVTVRGSSGGETEL
jgi:A118 family predicted phage portal protein